MSVSPGTSHAVAGHVATGSCVWHADVLMAVKRCHFATAVCLSRARSCPPIQSKRTTSPTRDRVPSSWTKCVTRVNSAPTIKQPMDFLAGLTTMRAPNRGAPRPHRGQPGYQGISARALQESKCVAVRRSQRKRALLPYGGPTGSSSCSRPEVPGAAGPATPACPIRTATTQVTRGPLLVLRRHGSDLPLPPKTRYAVLFWSG